MLLPVILQRKFKNIGIFSLIVLCFTLVSFALIAYVCISIIIHPLEESNKIFNLQLTEKDVKYVKWDFSMLPMFCSTMMNIFEGNQQILNLYAEADKPKSFFVTVSLIFIVLSVFFASLIGILGYLAFGNSCESTILFNMPNDAAIGIAAKLCYVTTIMGSYVILLQPIFHIVETQKFYQSFLEPSVPEPPLEEEQHYLEQISDSNYDDQGEPEEYQIDKPIRMFKFVFFRVMLVTFITLSAFVFPNLNVMLVLGGAILGTTMTVIMPVVFYNRAYSHPELETTNTERAQRG